MLDDSLSASRLDPASPEVTLGDSLDASPEASASSHPRALEIGTRFAGYQIRGYLGQGAMGVVYEAWDEADSPVALRLVHSPTKRAADRLLREARALARIAHPNIVQIRAADVHRGAVYLAMQLIEGRNLREWLDEPRHWSAILELLIGAGRGLAAAHAAGILHHDFKPENILIEWNDRPLVLDFGTARLSPTHPEHLTLGGDEHGADESDTSGAPMSGSFANLSAFELPGVGPGASLRDTTAYMAPEQHERGADFRSDQFGFCVTLFEAIYGAHPFPAPKAQDMIEAAQAGRIEFPDTDRRAEIPRWLERAIVRGLSPRSEDRFATMEELLEALERHPRRRRRRRQALTIAAVGVAAIGLGVLVPRAEERAACADFGAEIDEAGLSSEDLATLANRAELHESHRPGLASLSAGIESWTEAWTAARTTQCQQALAQSLPRAVEAAQARCLDGQLAMLAAITGQIPSADPQLLTALAQHSEAALVRLPEPERCLAETVAAIPPEYDTDPSESGSSSEVATFLRWLSPVAPISLLAFDLLETIMQLGSDPEPISTELAFARVNFADGNLALAGGAAAASVLEAERLGDDRLRAEALVELGRILAHQPPYTAEALVVLDLATAALDRVDAPLWLRERHLLARALTLAATGELDLAKTELEALRRAASERGHPQTVARLELELAALAFEQGDTREALALAERARKVLDGAPRKELAAADMLLAELHLALGQLDEAEAALSQAITLAGPTDPRPRLALQAKLALARGDDPGASEYLRERLALTPQENEHGARAAILYELGQTHQRAGRSEPALANFREARRLAQRAEPRDVELVARTELALGLTLLASERRPEAKLVLEDVASDWPETLEDGPEAGDLATALADLRRTPSNPEAAESDPD